MNFDLTLKGSNEFFNNTNNKTYFILKVDSVEKQNYMANIFNKFIDNQNKFNKQKHFIGIDFEYNRVRKNERDVALMQINLENDSNDAHIFVLYPPELTKNNNNTLIELITHPLIYKILHGGESLDIPYMFSQLLIKQNLIDKFCHNFYDTRFLCEYYHIENNINYRCSIYFPLLEHNIISQNKFHELENVEKNIEKNLGKPLYNIHIDIHKLDFEIFNYSLYDVVFLPQLVRKFINMNDAYTKYVPQITSMINKYKRNPSDLFNDLEKQINTINQYFIYENNKPITLNDIWEIYNATIYHKYFSNIIQITYFKKFIELLLKFIVYQNLFNNFTIYINKKNIAKNISWNKFNDFIKQYEHVYHLIQSYDELIKKDLTFRLNTHN